MVTVSYPGVYIEEVPSGVRTITGVATSIAAFVGYTRIGPINRAVKIFNFGDFEREFGGLDRDSDLSYAVYHFFQNGGNEAWIVRVAMDAIRAGITLCNEVTGSTPVLRIEALTEGEWGNTLRLEVDYDAVNPASLFNLTVTEYRESNGRLRAFRSETHRNLSMNSYHTNYAVDVVRANSNLIRLERVFDLDALGSGWSASGDLGAFDWTGLNDDCRRLAITINGDGPHEFDLFDPGGGISDLAGLAASIETRVRALSGDDAFRDFTCVPDGNSILATSGEGGERSAVHFSNAGIRNAARVLSLGIANGGREVTAAAMRPAQTGTILLYNLNELDFDSLSDDLTASVTISVGDSVTATVSVPVWTAASKPGNPQELRTRVQAALNDAAPAELQGAAVTITDNQLRVVAGGTNPNTRLNFTGLGISVEQNVARYALGVGLTSGAQTSPESGNNGFPPGAVDLRGSRAEKTGFYALENVDLFNLLIFPNISESTVLTPALDYCEEKRAFGGQS